jgi:hypothetical protein
VWDFSIQNISRLVGWSGAIKCYSMHTLISRLNLSPHKNWFFFGKTAHSFGDNNEQAKAITIIFNNSPRSGIYAIMALIIFLS